MKKVFFYFIGLLLFMSCTGPSRIHQDVSYEDNSYVVNTWFKEDGVKCSGSGRIVYDVTVNSDLENLENVKTQEFEKAERIMCEMQGKVYKSKNKKRH